MIIIKLKRISFFMGTNFIDFLIICEPLISRDLNLFFI